LKNDKANRLKYSVASGGAFTLDVQCQRVGYDGPISLSIDSPRNGWQTVNDVIPAKANEVRMYVLPPLDFAAGEIADFKIVGRAEAGGHELVSTMATTLQLRAARPQLPYPPAWHDGTLFVSGLGNKPRFYVASGSTTELTLPRTTNQTQFAINFERTDAKFKDTPLTVIPLGLPPGLTAEVKRNGNGPKETYDVTLKAAKEIADGDYLFRYFAYAEMNGQGRATLSGDIRLKIVAGEAPPEVDAKTTDAKTTDTATKEKTP